MNGIDLSDVKILPEERLTTRLSPWYSCEGVCGDVVVEEIVGVRRHHAEVALGVGESALDGDEFEVEEAARRALNASFPWGLRAWIFVSLSQGGDGGERDGVAGLFEGVDEGIEGVGEVDILFESTSEFADGGVDLSGASEGLSASEISPIGILGFVYDFR